MATEFEPSLWFPRTARQEQESKLTRNIFAIITGTPRRMELLNRQRFIFTILGTSRGRKEILFPEALVCAKMYAPIETLISPKLLMFSKPNFGK